jgi:hypothetical protein
MIVLSKNKNNYNNNQNSVQFQTAEAAVVNETEGTAPEVTSDATKGDVVNETPVASVVSEESDVQAVKPEEVQPKNEPEAKEVVVIGQLTTSDVVYTSAQNVTTKASTEPVVKEEAPKEKVHAETFKVGDLVKVKPGAKTPRGDEIPGFAFRNQYHIEKILSDRVILLVEHFRIATTIDMIEHVVD